MRFDRLFTIALLLIGSMLLGNYAFAPETQIARPIHGFAMETNGTMIELGRFTMVLDVESGVLSLYGEYEYVNATRDNGRIFRIIVVLPFLVQSYNAVPNYMPSVDQWEAINTNVTGVAASAVSAKFVVNSTNPNRKYFYSEFVVAKTYVNSHRGSYTVVLPLDAGIDGAYFPNLSSLESYAYCCQRPSEIDVYLNIPETAGNVQPFPSAKLGFISRYYDNATLNSAEWNMTQPTQVTLSFVDQTEQSTYDFSVIMGSLLLGAGISGIADYLKEYSTARKLERLA